MDWNLSFATEQIPTDWTTVMDNNCTDDNCTVGDGGFPPLAAWINYLELFGELIIGSLAIFGNGLVLVAIARETALQSFTNYLVASLATADLLVGLVGTPSVLVSFRGYPNNFYGCLLLNAVIIVLTQISVFGLLVIAVERFYAIKYPFKYHEHCTERVAVLVIAFTWFAGLVVGLVPIFGWNTGKEAFYGDQTPCSFTLVIDMGYMVYANFFGCILVPLFVMLLVYCYIYAVVRKQIRQIESSAPPGGNQTVKATTGDNKDESGKKMSKMKQKFSLKKETKAAKWFAVVIAIFTICWLPLHLLNTVTLFYGIVNIPAIIVAVLFSHANSAVNPVLYAFSSSKFKNAFKKLMCCKFDDSFETETTAVTQ